MRQVPQHTNRNFRPLTMRHSILPIPSKVEFVTERETFLVYPAVVIPFIFRDDENNVIVIDFVRLVLVSGLVAEDEITGLYVVLKDNRFMIIFSDIFYDFFIHFTCSFLFFSYLYYTLCVITCQYVLIFFEEFPGIGSVNILKSFLFLPLNRYRVSKLSDAA